MKSEPTQLNFEPLRGEKLFMEAVSIERLLPIITISSFVLIFLAIAVPPLFVVTGPLLIAAVIYGYLTYARWKSSHDWALQQFADVNGLIYTKKMDSSQAGPGTLFSSTGHSDISDVFTGRVGELSHKLFSYQWREGKRSFFVLVMDVELPVRMPHFVIDSLIEKSESILPNVFDKKQRISLEGDFDRYFALYSTEARTIDALTILAPNVMETIMAQAANCDIEIIDNHVYFYWHNEGSETYEKMYKVEAVIMGKILKYLERYPSNTPTVAEVAGQSGQLEGSPLERLRTQKNLFYLSTSIAVVPLAILARVYNLENYWSLAIMVLVVCTILYAGRQEKVKADARKRLADRFKDQQ